MTRSQTTMEGAHGTDRRRGRAGRAHRVASVVASIVSPFPLLAVPVLAALGACGNGTPPARHTWPPGTVLALNGTPITADQVDAIGSIIARTEPDYVLVQLRRIALTNVIFHRVAAIQIGGPRYEAARKTATELAHALQAGEVPDPGRTDILQAQLDGNFKALGLQAWNWAVDAPIGVWSDPIESVGAFGVLRVDSRTPAPVARKVTMQVTAWFVPYLQMNQPTDPVEARLDQSKIEFVDESWRDIVPESWKHRLRGGTL